MAAEEYDTSQKGQKMTNRHEYIINKLILATGYGNLEDRPRNAMCDAIKYLIKDGEQSFDPIQHMRNGGVVCAEPGELYRLKDGNQVVQCNDAGGSCVSYGVVSLFIDRMFYGDLTPYEEPEPKLEPGCYWIKQQEGRSWEIAEVSDEGVWTAFDSILGANQPFAIHPDRICSPDETVPDSE